MTCSTMSAQLPRLPGEDAVTYVERLSVYLGYMKAGGPEPLKAWSSHMKSKHLGAAAASTEANERKAKAARG